MSEPKSYGYGASSEQRQAFAERVKPDPFAGSHQLRSAVSMATPVGRAMVAERVAQLERDYAADAQRQAQRSRRRRR